jgi:hypothetical protein
MVLGDFLVQRVEDGLDQLLEQPVQPGHRQALRPSLTIELGRKLALRRLLGQLRRLRCHVGQCFGHLRTVGQPHRPACQAGNRVDAQSRSRWYR